MSVCNVSDPHGSRVWMGSANGTIPAVGYDYKSFVIDVSFKINAIHSNSQSTTNVGIIFRAESTAPYSMSQGGSFYLLTFFQNAGTIKFISNVGNSFRDIAVD
eukprot:246579_1